MAYLTREEYIELGFDCCMSDFSTLANRAKTAIDLYTQSIYNHSLNFEDDYDFRKQAVKMAMAYQIDYLNKSGIMTADDKQAMASVSIGRTTINYGGSQNGTTPSQRFNLSVDAENALKSAGFSTITGVCYDR